MSKKQSFLFLSVIMMSFLFLVFLFLVVDDPIDRCLDHGGAWDYTHTVCSSDCESQGINWDPENKVCMFENIEEKRLN